MILVYILMVEVPETIAGIRYTSVWQMTRQYWIHVSYGTGVANPTRDIPSVGCLAVTVSVASMSLTLIGVTNTCVRQVSGGVWDVIIPTSVKYGNMTA